MCVCKAGLNIFHSEMREGLEEVVEVRVVSQVSNDALHGYTGTLDYGLARHDFGVNDNPVFIADL
jgi:hypothetical protein